jgi:C-terminal processing protease CtpA/Prc
MKRSFLSLTFCLFYLALSAQIKPTFNKSMEKLDGQHKLAGWNLSLSSSGSVRVDSIERKVGKYSLAFEGKGAGDGVVVASYVIPQAFKGSKIELKGYLKTQDVTGGFAGLWLRVDGDGSTGPLAFDNMNNQGLAGTTDWKQYSIQLPYDDEKATRIVLGGLIVGKGKLWMEGLILYIDGKPIELATPKTIKLTKAQLDTAYAKKSGTDTILLKKQQLTNLRLLAEIWGLVKYHHPLVAKGEFNMDAELFRVLPAILKAQDSTEFSAVMENWLDRFGLPESCKNCKPDDGKNISQKPDYGGLFKNSVLSHSLSTKLMSMIDNQKSGENYYASLTPGVGNPIFMHELPYAAAYPDAGIRLLALYRYWNMIEYFYPDKYLIAGDWEDKLREFIPQFVQANNTQDYLLASLKLISSIHDTHANIWSNHPALEAYRGKFALPVQAKFVENKLVVTGYYTETPEVKQEFKPGDIISSIDGHSVDELIKKYLPITAASNYATQLRDMPRNYLLRSNKLTLDIELIRDGKKEHVTAATFERSQLNMQIDHNPDPKAPAYKVMDGGIGYLFPARYKNEDLPEIKKALQGTKGIVVDMRCYPSDFMPFTFVPYVKTGNADFVKFRVGNISNPGLFKITDPLANPGTGDYKGKVVVIVNQETQSNAEYTTMAFQSSPNVVVIGSTTAGADGNVSPIVLPGGISTMISGIGVLYPDNTETQGKGVKIDLLMHPTIAGIKAGKDELLDKAIQIINQR